MDYLRRNRNMLLGLSVAFAIASVIMFAVGVGRAFQTTPVYFIVFFYTLIFFAVAFVVLSLVGAIAQVKADKKKKPLATVCIGAVFVVFILASPFIGLFYASIKEARARRISQAPMSFGQAQQIIQDCKIEAITLSLDNNRLRATMLYKPEQAPGNSIADLYQVVESDSWDNLVKVAQEATSTCGEIRIVDYRTL